MSIEEAAGKAVLGLVNSEGLQNGAQSVLGKMFPYFGLKKRALDAYLSDIEKSDMTPESKVIAILTAKENLKKLKNKASVVEIAVENAQEGTVFDETSQINQDWLDRYMDSAGFVSDEKMQFIWGKILANEFEEPGSTPQNMPRILSEITPQYAKAFQAICSMECKFFFVDDAGEAADFQRKIIVPLDENRDCLKNNGLTPATFSELDALGLIKIERYGGLRMSPITSERAILHVGGVVREIEIPQDGVPIGHVLLTSAGDCLKRITETISIEGYDEVVIDFMKRSGVNFKENTNYIVLDNKDGSCLLRTDS